MKKTIELDQECSHCSGTGLYAGMGENKGAAVVCHDCNGTGKFHFVHSYNEFEYRKEKKGIKRVYECNPGIGIGEGITEEGKVLTLEDFGGMPHEDWIQDFPFPAKSEMRKYTCPAWWYQCADYDKKPHWKECICCGSFSDCKHFKDKKQCWERFDKEQVK